MFLVADVSWLQLCIYLSKNMCQSQKCKAARTSNTLTRRGKSLIFSLSSQREVNKGKLQPKRSTVHNERTYIMKTTYVSPAGPAPPPGRRHISWRGWSRNRLRRVDPQLVHTPRSPHPDTSSVCWLTRRSRGWPNHWWGRPAKPAGTPKDELNLHLYTHTDTLWTDC